MVLNRCADQRSAWAELRIVSNGLKRGRAALNCGQGGLGARNNQRSILSAVCYLHFRWMQADKNRKHSEVNRTTTGKHNPNRTDHHPQEADK